MSDFSVYAPFGLMDYSGAPTYAEQAYDALKAALGGDKVFDFTEGTEEEASLLADALQIGYARATIERARNQQYPMSALDKLPSLEDDWAVIPGPNDTVYQRQQAVAARMLIMHGPREEALYTDLVAILGTDLVKIRATQPSERITYPASYMLMASTGTFPAPSTTPKFLQLLDPVAITGSPLTVRYLLQGGVDLPLVGEFYCIDSSIPGLTEAVRIDAVLNGNGAPTTVTVNVTLDAHADFPKGAQLSVPSAPGFIFQNTQDIDNGEPGPITIPATLVATAVGAAVVPAFSAWSFISTLPGVLAVVNPAAGVTGNAPKVTATFVHPHSVSAWMLSACPVWQSTQRELQIIVKPASARNVQTRRRVNQVMQRHVKTTTRWRIIETSSTTTVGPWIVARAIIGATALGDVAFVF